MQGAEPETSLLYRMEQSGLAALMRESAWAYPIVETIHIIGFVILVGAAVMFDLRLLGLSKSLSVSALARHLLRWSQASIFVVIPTGFFLFITDATSLGLNPALQLKLALIILALANATFFHRFTFASVQTWDRDVPAPGAARLAGLLSLVLWLSIIVCGRMIAYV